MITRLFFLFAFVVSTLLTGCQKNSGDDVTPDTGCRLEKYTALIQQPGSAQPRNEQATYTYDQNGLLIKADSSWTVPGDASGVNKSNGTTVTTYSYNAAGFLTASSSQTMVQTTLSPGNVSTDQRSLQTSFTYTNDKLTGYVAKSVAGSGLEITVTGTFEYDASGNAVKQTAVNTYTFDPEKTKEKPQYPSGWQRTWTYSNKQLMDYTEKSGTTEIHPYTIQNGLVTKATYPEHYTLHEYDQQQRLIKTQLFQGNKLNYYFTQEWNEGKLPSASFSLFKGFPDLQPAMGYTGIMKRFNFYADYLDSGVVQLTSIQATAQLNGEGFITNNLAEQKDFTPGIPSSTGSRTETFTYTGCR